MFYESNLMRSLLHAVVLAISLTIALQAHAQSFAFGGSSGTAAMTLYFSDGTSELVTAADQGWWSPTAYNFEGNPNIITGHYYDILWNDFFIFNLTKHAADVEAATLDIDTWSVSGAPMVSLWDVSTPLAALENLNAPPSAAIYADLGSGTRYGDEYRVTKSHTDIEIPLNDAGIAAIRQAAGNPFAIGGSANTPIPEPSAVWLLGAALAGLGALRYRGRQTAKRSALS